MTYPDLPWGVGTQTVVYDAGPVTLALDHEGLAELASDITGTEPTSFMAITYGDGRPGTIDLFLGVGTIGGVIHPDEVSSDFDSPDFEEIPFNLFFVVDYEGFGGTDNEGNWSRVYLTSPVRVELDHESVMLQAAADAISGSDLSVSAWDGALDDPTIIVMSDEAQPYFMAVVVDPGPVDEQGKPALVSHVGTCLVTLFHEDLGVLIESRDRPCWISR